MAKHQKRRQFGNRRPSNSQILPNPAFSEFSSTVKALWHILQCLHHLGLLKGHLRDQTFPNSILKKITDLNSFLKPGQRNSQFDRAIDQANRTWALNVIQEMIAHYESCLVQLKAQITLAKLSKNLDFDRAFSNAIKWGKQNFRHKLEKSTLTTFESFVRSINSSHSITHTPSVFPTTPVAPSTSFDPSPPQSPPPQPNHSSPLPSSLIDLRPGPSAPSPAPLPNPPSHPLAAQPAPSSHPSQPSPSHPTHASDRSYSDALKSPPHHVQSNKLENNTFWKFRHTSSTKWQLPKVTKKILLLGDSNLSRINLNPDPNIQVECFPGATFDSFRTLARNYVGPEPETIILNVGINNKKDPKPIPQMRNMMSAIRNKFRKSIIYFVELQSSSKLPVNEVTTLKELNSAVSLHKDKLKIIPKIPQSKFRVCRDQVHWTEQTANCLYVHWLKNLNLN